MNLSVLYVEDEHLILQANKQQLEDIVTTVYTASNGEEGLAKYKKYQPQLVLTDIKMPKLNGLEMAEKIFEEDKNAKIIIISAYPDKEYFLEAIDLNIEKFIIKPLKNAEIRAAVQDIYKKYSAERQLLEEAKQRKSIEESLRKEKRYLELLFENSPEAILIIEIDSNKIIKVNNEFTNMFGFTKEEAVGQRIDDLVILREFEDESNTLTKNLAKGKKIKHKSVRIRKDGSRIHVSILGIPIKSSESKDSVYLIYRNISERVNSEKIQSTMSNIAKAVNTSEDLKEDLELPFEIISY